MESNPKSIDDLPEELRQQVQKIIDSKVDE